MLPFLCPSRTSPSREAVVSGLSRSRFYHAVSIAEHGMRLRPRTTVRITDAYRSGAAIFRTPENVEFSAHILPNSLVAPHSENPHELMTHFWRANKRLCHKRWFFGSPKKHIANTKGLTEYRQPIWKVIKGTFTLVRLARTYKDR